MYPRKKYMLTFLQKSYIKKSKGTKMYIPRKNIKEGLPA